MRSVSLPPTPDGVANHRVGGLEMTGTIGQHRRQALAITAMLAVLLPLGAAGQSPATTSAPPLATLAWASHGDADDPMQYPSGVTVAPDDRVWVVDSDHSRFAIFDPDGTFLGYWGAAGKGEGEFVLHRPNGDGFSNVAFAPDGSFYVLDAGQRRVEHFAADRSFLGEFGGFGSGPGTFADPLAIAVDADGSILVLDDVRNVVERLMPDGTVLSSFTPLPPGQSANSLALDAHGDIYVSTCCPGAGVRRFGPDGTLRWEGDISDSDVDQAAGMAIDAAGRVFVGGVPETASDRIRVIAPDGSPLTRFGGSGDVPEDVGFPFAVALDGAGGLYATDYIDGSLKKFQLGPELAASGSIDGWPMFKGDAARRGEGADGPIGSPLLRWRFQAGGAVPDNVSIGADIAFASSDDGVLHALHLGTGEELWSFVTDQPPLHGPVLDDDAVYVIDGAGVLHALDATTGRVRWHGPVLVGGASLSTAGDGALYIGSGAGDLVAIDERDGSERWRVRLSEVGDPVHNPAFQDGKVYVTADGGGSVAVDAADGSIVWRFDTGGLSTGTAVVADGLAYVGASGDATTGMLWALDAGSGAIRWQVAKPIFTPAVVDGVAFSGSVALGVSALDASTGDVLWTFPVDGPARPLGVADGVVYVPADQEHRVYALDAATGMELWRFDVDSGIDCCIAIAKGAVYVGTMLGGVYAIGGDGTVAR
jgi:outer membrane protein assembly factor BamB